MKRPTMRGENARTLAAALGLEVERAAKLLDQPIQVTHDDAAPWACALARHAALMLARTFKEVGTALDPVRDAVVELHIGACTSLSNASRTAWVSLHEGRLIIANDLRNPNGRGAIHELFLLIGACYAAARVVHLAVGPGLPHGTEQPVLIDPQVLGGGIDLEGTLELGTAFLAGAGAVGNAILYALGLLRVRGVLYVVDPKKVNDGILNRCLCFESEDVGDAKAMALCARMERRMPEVKLIPRDVDLATAVRELGDPARIERLFVGVDSRRARRALQKELPREVYDASTTGIAEVVLTFSMLPFQDACMACTYRQEEGELAHEAHVAELLGVTLEDVRSGCITEAAAGAICRKYGQIEPLAITGLAYDSLFKALCSEGQLKTADDRQVLAPFAFVSAVAGALLVLELAARLHSASKRFNYWRVSPWSTPNFELQQLRPALADCEVCSRRVFQAAAKGLWGSPGG